MSEQKKVESPDVPKEEILKLTAVINNQSNYIIDHEQRVKALLRTIESLEGQLADLRVEADRYRAANSILLDGDHEVSMANEINKLQIENKQLEAERDKLKEDKLHLEILAEGRLQHNKKLEADNERLKKAHIKFHKWMLENGWEEHSSGRYYFKLEYRSQWPPKDENVCSESDLYDKWLKSYLENK